MVDIDSEIGRVIKAHQSPANSNAILIRTQFTRSYTERHYHGCTRVQLDVLGWGISNVIKERVLLEARQDTESKSPTDGFILVVKIRSPLVPPLGPPTAQKEPVGWMLGLAQWMSFLLLLALLIVLFRRLDWT